MQDSFGRIVKKLRISITDRCNMRCIYCMPNNNTNWINQDNVLSYGQITRLSTIFTTLGIEKIKITGGEPMLRPKVEDLVRSLSRIDKIKSISMTTNGLLLIDKIKQLKHAGLHNVNISLDTFRAERFKAMTGIDDGLGRVLDSIKAAQNEDIQVKINVVIMRGWNDDEILDFVQFSRDTGCIVKFIEFMPLDGTGIWAHNLVVSKKEMINRINNANFGKLVPLNNDVSDPARLYSFDGEDGEDDGISSSNGSSNNDDGNISNKYKDKRKDKGKCKGTIGFIPSITEPFCQYCDRVRITSDGKFYTCLFDKTSYDLKDLLRKDRKSDDEIRKYIIECTSKKPEGIIKIIKLNSLKPTLNHMHAIGG